MKKTLLISTALFLASASFAQTKINNNETIKSKTSIQHKNGTRVNNSENASTATTIHSADVANVKDGSSAKIKEEDKSIVAEKQAVAAKAKMKAEQTKATADEDKTVAVSTRSDAKVHANSKGNNINENASVNSNARVSTGKINKDAGDVKTTAKENIHATIKGANRSQVAVKKASVKSVHKINAASSATVHATKASVQKVHVKPVRVKTGAQVKTITGIRIK